MITIRRSFCSASCCIASRRVVTNTSSCPSRMRRQSSTFWATMASMIFARVSAGLALGPILGGNTTLREKQGLDPVAFHVRAGAAGDDLAALHDEVLVGERAREI